MKKAFLIYTGKTIFAITEDEKVFEKIISTNVNYSIEDLERHKDFVDNKEFIYQNLNDFEFKYNQYSWFMKGSGPYLNILRQLEFDNTNNTICFDNIEDKPEGNLYTGMGTWAIGLRVQYVKIEKPVVKRIMRVNFDEEKEWTFTFSTYKDDLISHVYNKVISESENELSHIEILKRIDEELRNNPSLPTGKYKVERNIYDFKNENSVFIRIDREIISDEDMDHFINRFKNEGYRMFSSIKESK